MCITGSEHHISNLKVDGYYIDSANKPVVVDFLGDIWHGHPSLWGKKNRWGVEYKSLFQTTQERFLKISQLGYSIVYIWQKDFITRDKTAPQIVSAGFSMNTRETSKILAQES